MTHDRLQELASSSVRLNQLLGELRGAGLREVVGPDPLVHADASDADLEEFLSLAVREAAEHVIFGLALSLPACILERGVGEEALEYCLAHRNLSEERRSYVFQRMSTRGPNESLRATHRRISDVAVRAGTYVFYQEFLRDNIDELVDECPEELADFMLGPQFSPSGLGLICLNMVMEHSRNIEPYIQRWIDWIKEERFDWDGPGQGDPAGMYRYLGHYRNDARFRAVRVAAHAYLVHLLQSPEKVQQAWHHLHGILSAPYTAADELVTAIRRSGLQRDQLESEVLRVPLDALWELSRDPTGQSKEFQALWTLVSQEAERRAALARNRSRQERGEEAGS